MSLKRVEIHIDVEGENISVTNAMFYFMIILNSLNYFKIILRSIQNYFSIILYGNFYWLTLYYKMKRFSVFQNYLDKQTIFSRTVAHMFDKIKMESYQISGSSKCVLR